MHGGKQKGVVCGRVISVDTGEDMGRVTQITYRVSGKYKGHIQGVTTEKYMNVMYHPKMFVAFYVASQGRFESKFVHGHFKIVDKQVDDSPLAVGSDIFRHVH